MINQDAVQRAGEERNSKLGGELAISGVFAEESPFVFACLCNRQPLVYVFLRAALHAIVTQPQWEVSAVQHMQRVCTLVHEVDLGDDTDGSLALWVNFFGELERVAISQVIGGRRQGQNERVWLADET